MASNGQIYDTADRFQRDLLRRERAAASQMVHEYGQVWRRIQREIDSLVREYNALRQAGKAPSDAMLSEWIRLQELRRQVESEINKFAQYAGDTIQAEQLAAVKAAENHVQHLTELQDPGSVGIGFNRLPVPALEAMVGFLADGSPLKSLLDQLGPAGAQAVHDALVNGLALGLNPNQIARECRAAMGLGLTRSLRIARTETLRAYRDASLRSMNANSDIIGGWTWRSARNERTCAMCWAMDGTQHKLDERLDDHVCGRCFAVPRTKTWEELGFSGMQETRYRTPDTGVEAFKKLPAAQQQKILGAAKYAAWKDGKFDLPDLVGRKFDPRWGSMRYEKSLKELGIDWRDYQPKPTPTPTPAPAPLSPAEQWRQLGLRLDPELGKIVQTKQNWSGNILMETPQNMSGAIGRKQWSCDITIRTDVTDPHVLIHEMLHGYSPGLGPNAYQNYRGWEEGTVEKLTELLGQEVLKNIGEPQAAYYPTYKPYTEKLEELRKLTKLTPREFYLRLFRQDLYLRELETLDILREAGYDSVSAGNIVHKAHLDVLSQ